MKSYIAKQFEDMYPVLEPFLHPMDRTPFGDEFLRTGNYYEWYATIAYDFGPISICEIGVRFGYSAIAMLHGAKKAGINKVRYLGIDNESAECGSNLIAAKNISSFTDQLNIWTADSTNTGHVSSKFELVHVDGMHTVEWMMKDLQFAKAVLKNGGIIIVDDVTFFPSLLEPARNWGIENGFDPELIYSHRGTLLLR